MNCYISVPYYSQSVPSLLEVPSQ